MNTRAIFAAAVTAVALSAVPVAAQSLTGTWSLESQTGRGTQTITLELVQDGAELTGTATFAGGGRRGGGGGRGAQPVAIADGSVDGQAFSFTVTLSFGDNSFTQSFSGTFEGDAMEGTIEGGRGGGRPFTGSRER